MPGDGITWKAHATIAAYSAEQAAWATARLGHEPDGAELAALFAEPDLGVTEHPGNLLVTVGLNVITQLIIGSGGTSFAHANAIVGAGSSNTAATIADVALGGNGSSSTAWYQQADSGYPTQSNGVITCVATFGASNANFSWQEWCFATGSGGITAGNTLASVATGVNMLNHKIQALGPGAKTSGQVFVFTGTVTISL